MAGWIKLHRQLLESRWGSNLEMMGFWASLLMMANHKTAFTYDGTQINPGQLMTSRDALSSKFKLSPSKIYRMLSALSDAKQIEQRTSNKNTIITITNWVDYQECEQQMNNKRTTGEQPVNTNKNVKNVKNERKNTNTPVSPDALMVIETMNKILNSRYTASKGNLKFINARLSEGFVLNDFETVLHHKHREWAENAEMVKFLRPETLFGNKFEGYLNSASNQVKSREEKLADFFNAESIQPIELI